MDNPCQKFVFTPHTPSTTIKNPWLYYSLISLTYCTPLYLRPTKIWVKYSCFKHFCGFYIIYFYIFMPMLKWQFQTSIVCTILYWFSLFLFVNIPWYICLSLFFLFINKILFTETSGCKSFQNVALVWLAPSSQHRRVHVSFPHVVIHLEDISFQYFLLIL